MANVQVRYWAAAKEAAGLTEEDISAATLAEALDVSNSRHAKNPHFAAVLAHSSILLDGAQVGPRAADTLELTDGNIIEVLPAFAGG